MIAWPRSLHRRRPTSCCCGGWLPQLTHTLNRQRYSNWIKGRNQPMSERLRQDLCDLPLLDVAERIQRREVSPVEVTERVLARIDSLDDTFNAFVTVLAKQALDDARKADRE